MRGPSDVGCLTWQTEKLSKIQMLDEQIIEAMAETEDFDLEALTQDEKTVEIKQAMGNLVAMLRGSKLRGSMTEKVIKMYRLR